MNNPVRTEPVSIEQQRAKRSERSKLTLRSVGVAKALDEHFGDNQWHTIEEVVEKIGHLVPAEIAARRIQNSIDHNENSNLKEDDLSEQVFRGRRWILSKALSSIGAESGGPGRRLRWSRFRLAPGKGGRNFGGRHPLSKHTDEEIEHLLLLWFKGGVTQKELAEQFGISKSWVYSLLSKKVWKHIDHEAIQRRALAERG